MGISNAPAQRLGNTIPQPRGNAMVYMDDFICYNHTFTEHQEHLDHMLSLIRQAGLKLAPDKCEFGADRMVYLGHVVSADGNQPAPQNVECPAPSTVKEVRAFCGLPSYYRRFIHNFAKIARPMTGLLKADVPFHWGEEQHAAFEYLK